MGTITSRANPRVARARGLRRRPEREATGLFLVEGTRVVYEAAAARQIEELIVAPDLLRSDVAIGLVARLRAEGVEVLEVSTAVFESLSSRDGPQGIAAVARQRWVSLGEVEAPAGLGWVGLDSIQDPGNLGTILRTCDAVGAPGVILLGDTADPYDPAAVRASTGAVFTRQLVRASPGDLSEWKREQGITILGTSDRAPLDYRSVAYVPPNVLLMGGEQKGLGPELLTLCDQVVGIPMVGACDSLNLAVATGLVLYEAFYQSRR